MNGCLWVDVFGIWSGLGMQSVLCGDEIGGLGEVSWQEVCAG